MILSKLGRSISRSARSRFPSVAGLGGFGARPSEVAGQSPRLGSGGEKFGILKGYFTSIGVNKSVGAKSSIENWRLLLANPGFRRLFSSESLNGKNYENCFLKDKKEIPKGDGNKKSESKGQYADLVTRVTNFHNENKGLMVLAGDVFDVPIRKDIIHRVVRWQLAKRQQGTHSTKTISEVSGTGRKPYKQKGTGRARHGTLRGPQFRGGATMHGPKPHSHAIKLNKKVRRLGLKIALSARAAEGKLLVFEDLEVPNHKTKNIVNYVTQMEDTKKLLLVDGAINDNLKLATGNLHYVNVLPSVGLNVYNILQHDTLVMTRDAIDRIVTRMHTPIKR